MPPEPTTLAETNTAVIAQLNSYSYDNIKEIFTTSVTQHSGVRHKDELIANTGSMGFCTTQTAVSTSGCTGAWGHQAYKHICAASTTYTKDEAIFIHPTLYSECGNATLACKVLLCLKNDDSSNARNGVATISGSAAPPSMGVPAGSRLEVYYSVICGVRNKFMVCPLEKGDVLSQCAVKKSCASYSDVAPRSSNSYHGLAVWTESWENHLQTSNLLGSQAALWTELIQSTEMVSALTTECSKYCGFY